MHESILLQDSDIGSGSRNAGQGDAAGAEGFVSCGAGTSVIGGSHALVLGRVDELNLEAAETILAGIGGLNS